MAGHRGARWRPFRPWPVHHRPTPKRPSTAVFERAVAGLTDEPLPPWPRALGRQLVESDSQIRERGDRLVLPRPLGLQIGGGELRRRIGRGRRIGRRGRLTQVSLRVALAASMRPVGAASKVAR